MSIHDADLIGNRGGIKSVTMISKKILPPPANPGLEERLPAGLFGFWNEGQRFVVAAPVTL